MSFFKSLFSNKRREAQIGLWRYVELEYRKSEQAAAYRQLAKEAGLL